MNIIFFSFFEKKNEINNKTYMTSKDIQKEVKCSFNQYIPCTFVARPDKHFPREVDSQNSWYILQDNDSIQELPGVKKIRA
jgi:hypothetical protein